MSPSFSCVSPKIDDSPPQGEWVCLKMHEVMRPSFSLPLSLSLSLHPPSQRLLLMAAATSARGFPAFLSDHRPPPNQTALSLPFPALVRMAECDVWRSPGRQRDKWCRWGAATHKRTEKSWQSSIWWCTELTGRGGRTAQCSVCWKKDKKISLRGNLLIL